MNAVAVHIVPDEVTDVRQLSQPRVDVELVNVRCQRDHVRHAGRLVRVTVHTLGAVVLRREHVVGRQNELNLVVVGNQAGEQIQAAAVGRVRRQHRVVYRQQVHRHAGHTRLATVLNAVAVEIVPHEIADVRGFGGVENGGINVARALVPLARGRRGEVTVTVGEGAERAHQGLHRRRPPRSGQSGRRHCEIQRILNILGSRSTRNRVELGSGARVAKFGKERTALCEGRVCKEACQTRGAHHTSVVIVGKILEHLDHRAGDR